MTFHSRSHSGFWYLVSALRQYQRDKHARSYQSSALILTLVIIGLVAALIFFLARANVKEQRLTSSEFGTLGAYYSAEAGIEDALARLAADKNIEVPTCKFGYAKTTACDSSDGTNFNSALQISDLEQANPASDPARIRINTFGIDSGLHSQPTTPANVYSDPNFVLNPRVGGDLVAPDPTQYVYDLRITSRVTSVGSVAGDGVTAADPCNNAPCGANNRTLANGQPDPSFIKKDSVREYSFDTSGDNVPDAISIFWNCNRNPTGSCTGNDNLLVTYVRDSCGSSSSTECTEDNVFPAGTSGSPARPLPNINNANHNLVKIRIKPVSSDPISSFAGVNISLVATKTAGGLTSAVKMQGSAAKIQSVGYFGGVKRRIEADYDRTSGALLGVFDYAVFAGSSFSQP